MSSEHNRRSPHSLRDGVEERGNTSEIAIRVSNLDKCYHIYGAPRDRLKQFVLPRLHRLTGQPLGQYFREFWALKNVSFDIKKGEILGFAGLMGAGRTEVARAIFGADQFDIGEIFIKGQQVQIKNPRDAVNYGIGYLSEDRKRYGLTLGMDLKENIVMSSMKKFLRSGVWVDFKKAATRAMGMVKALDIKTPSIEQKVKFLSGGNQQKVVIGKWLTADTDILIFDEPTRGIDVGAKLEIHRLIDELVMQGVPVLMISSELPEILNMCDRIYVLHEGEISAEYSREDATQEKVLKSAIGQ